MTWEEKKEERSKEEEKAQKRLAAQKIKNVKAKKARHSLDHKQDVHKIDSELKMLYCKL